MKLMVRWNQMKIKREISVFSLLKMFRSGFQLLSNIDWVSAYGSKLSAVTVLGVVGFLLAVRDGSMGNFNSLLLHSLSARNDSSKKIYFVPGLRNLGNNCFLNVVLQALASCLSFRCFLEDVKNLQSSSRKEQVEDLPLLLSLATLLEELSTLQEKSRPLNPQKVMTAMQQYIPQFQLSNQQDAAEAFLHLLSCLRDELSDSYMPNSGSLADVAAPTSRILAFERIKDIKKEPERWRQQYLGPLNGILGSFLTCQSCSSEVLCLHLQRSSMNAFGELVKIQGHINFPMILNLSPFVKCEAGIQKREMDKPKSLGEQPDLANTSHLKSADRHPDLMTVKDDASQFLPEPCSSLIENCSNTKFIPTLKATFDPPPPLSILYRLVSVVEHFGRAGSGHYTVYRGVTTQMEDRNGVRDIDDPLQWFRISDSEVHTASEEDVLGAEATLLFYERI
ncbi:ubiquitin carboxyl-terminal hydrolase 27 isoform X2 [Spinacia oleracea]|uniref:Ubiquitin carboxyl-terminal hydrolase n=1 Tax=Spinacia oleracea TaxID=3562 RepID=A0A9R0IBZ8_SPIOL|nr:ubiquitin carboxyl-terminal hydrolase 27 isoform X2 [Spinacia oleracea]